MTNPESLQKMELYSGQSDWAPTPHGKLLGQTLAENNLVEGKSVLELGAGVGNHTIVLARQNPKQLVATEITKERLNTTARNLEHNLGAKQGIELRVANWLDTPGEFDLIVTNPPFCKSGKQNRRYFIDSLILDGHKRLHPEGELIFVQSSMADIKKTKRRLQENGYVTRELARSKGPFRAYYDEDPTFLEEIERFEGAYEVNDGVRIETLVVLHAKLQPFEPPAGAHLPSE